MSAPTDPNASALTDRFLRIATRLPDQIVRKFQELSERDVCDRYAQLPHSLVAVAFGAICAMLGIILRWTVDTLWDGAGPFGLMVPIVLIATFFGRWLAGLVCLILTSSFAWYFVLPREGSFQFVLVSDGPRVIVNVAAGMFVVIVGELFRRTMRHALLDRELLLRELEHRVKNNFASVASMLRLQIKQNEDAPTVLAALHSALGRVESYAIVNSFLYRSDRYTGLIDVAAYLQQLCQTLQSTASTSDTQIEIHSELEQVTMGRDQAIAVGLLVNELVTNAVKHAFSESQTGNIIVKLSKEDDGAVLFVKDDGEGFTSVAGPDSFGMRLTTALAQQADARMELATDDNGTKYTFTFETLNND